MTTTARRPAPGSTSAPGGRRGFAEFAGRDRASGTGGADRRSAFEPAPRTSAPTTATSGRPGSRSATTPCAASAWASRVSSGPRAAPKNRRARGWRRSGGSRASARTPLPASNASRSRPPANATGRPSSRRRRGPRPPSVRCADTAPGTTARWPAVSRCVKCGHADNTGANAARNHLARGASADHRAAVRVGPGGIPLNAQWASKTADRRRRQAGATLRRTDATRLDGRACLHGRARHRSRRPVPARERWRPQHVRKTPRHVYCARLHGDF